VRVTVLDENGSRMEIDSATLTNEGESYIGNKTYFGSGIENVENGEYTLKVVCGSYVKEMTVTVDGDEEFIIDRSELDILEQFKDREMIVVLRWGRTPLDLDSHMTFSNGTDFYHIYYHNKVDSTTGTNLDVDDTDSFGPEVITVLKLQEGTYRYSIYDYTHGGSSTSTGIATSEAYIEVYISGEKVARYNAPNGVGCLWTVFEYDGATGTITEINTMTGGMDSSEVQ